MGWNKYTYTEYLIQSELEKLFIPTANKDFLLNCLEYLTSNPAISETRNKDIVLHLLDSKKVKSGKSHSFLEEDAFEKIIDYYDEKEELSKAMEATETALEYFQKSLVVRKEAGDKRGMAISLDNIATQLLKTGNTQKAFEFANQGMEIAKETGFPQLIKYSAATLKTVFQKQNKHKDAFEMYELEIKMRDSINNEETQKAALKKQLQYQYETQARELKNEQEKKDISSKAELKQREKERNYFVIGFALVIVLALFIFRSYRQKQKVNVIISKQKQEVETSRKEILDSIHYAKRIQKAHMPTEKYVQNTIDRLKKKA